MNALRLERAKRQATKAILNDPVLYAKERLGVELWGKQAEIARAVRDNRVVAIQSANGIGKSELFACLAAWWLERYEQSVVLVTGANWNAITNVLMPRVRTLIRRNEVFPEECIRQEKIVVSDTRYLVSRATNEPEGIQGLHSPNLLQLCDETSGVEQPIIDALKGNATGDNNRTVYSGNPLAPFGAFYDICTKGVRDSLPVFKVSAFEHPNVESGTEQIKGAVTRQSVEEKARDWCVRTTESDPSAVVLPWNGEAYIPDERFTARVLGQFPAMTQDAIFSRLLLERASAEPATGKPTAIGVDPARGEKGDEAVITLANASGVLQQIALRGQTLDQLTGRIVELRNDYAITNAVAVDCDGIGYYLVDNLRHHGVTCLDIHNGSRANDAERYFNLKAELYMSFKQALENGYRIPNDPKLLQQATAAKLEPNALAKKRVGSKDDYKKRTGESPDRLESAIYTYYVVSEAGTAMPPETYLPQEDHAHVRDFGGSIQDAPVYTSEGRQRLSDYMFGN